MAKPKIIEQTPDLEPIAEKIYASIGACQQIDSVLGRMSEMLDHARPPEALEDEDGHMIQSVDTRTPETVHAVFMALHHYRKVLMAEMGQLTRAIVDLDEKLSMRLPD